MMTEIYFGGTECWIVGAFWMVLLSGHCRVTKKTGQSLVLGNRTHFHSFVSMYSVCKWVCVCCVCVRYFHLIFLAFFVCVTSLLEMDSSGPLPGKLPVKILF